MVLEKGAIFADKYEILDALSTGTQASVYTALQKPLDRIIILKILSPALVSNQEIVSRFEREAKLLSTLNDDNITKIYDFGKYNGVYFFVSEYIEGQSVKELLERKKRLSPQFASHLILESAKVLARLHKQGIIHRDLKPGNILLTKDGKVKLTDFGLAFSQALPSLTIEGSILGTPAYMPPEQILGKAVDNRSDIYSLGVVFYELLTGKNPFVANTYSAIMHNVLNLKPVPIHKIIGSTEEIKELLQVVERMIKKQVSERFEDINEVVEKMQGWFTKDINKTWQLNISDLSKQTQSTIQPTMPVQKPISRRIVTIIILAVLFALAIIIPITQIKKPKENKMPVTINSTDPAQPLSSTLMSKRESSSIVNPNTSKTDSTIKLYDPMTSPDLRQSITSTAKIKIQVLPWATVYIDGKEIFTTPKDTSLALSLGQHSVKLVNPNFPAIETIISIPTSQGLNITIDLTERVSYLQISVTPWADIYIDDVFKATTPISQPLIVSVGKHRLIVKNPYYTPYQEVIEFKPSETIERNIVLQ